MSDGLVKLNIRPRPGWYVWAYKPYRTKKGHFIWRMSHIVAGPFVDALAALEEYPDGMCGLLHNRKLTVDEELKAFGQEKS